MALLPQREAPAELLADKGYHSRDTLKRLADGPWKPRVSERRIDGVLRWHGDDAARRAVYNNRARLRSAVARAAFRLRAEWVERSFALILDRGGMRRAWLRGRENLHKRYLIHVAGYNLGLIMRLLTGAGTPRELHAPASVSLFGLITPNASLCVIIVNADHTPLAVAAPSMQTCSTELWLSQRAVMPAMQDYYSMHKSQRSSDSRVYHSRMDCGGGEKIPPHERQSGRGAGVDYPLCEECMRIRVTRP